MDSVSSSPSSPVSPEPPVVPQASAIEKLPPRPAPTWGYVWNEWSPNARMVYLRNADEANTHLSLLQQGCIGFDLEWKPTYLKGAKENPVALVQLANDQMIFLVQVAAMKEFPSKLREILEDPAFVKAGVGIQGDSKKLYTDWGVSVQNCVDLSLLARTVDNARWKGKYNSSIGLARLVEVYCYRLLGKGKITRSNWESILKPPQQLYASNDAHAGYTVYNLLVGMIDPSKPPDTKYYTFSCSRGYYHDLSGLSWSPMNPNYDPGPPPPPRPDRDRTKNDLSDGAQVNHQEAHRPPDPNTLVQRHESLLKIAHSTWVRQQETQGGRSRHPQPHRSTFVIPEPLQNTSYRGGNQPYHSLAWPNHPAGSSSTPSPHPRSNQTPSAPRGVSRRHVAPASPAATNVNPSIQGRHPHPRPHPIPTPASSNPSPHQGKPWRYRNRQGKAPVSQPAVGQPL